MKNQNIIAVAFFLTSMNFLHAQDLVNDTLKTKEIKEVLVKAQRKKQFADHANYTFDKEAQQKARHTKDLLITLPELQFDVINNSVTSIKGGNVLFLINGIEATDNQIKSIAPNNVLRVEYFDIPPARYAKRAETIVNIVTRNPEEGYSFGADLSSAFTTGFVNGSAYAGYTKGKNDFGLEYFINYRDYDNRILERNYAYNLNNSYYKSSENQKDHFGYTVQNIALRFTNSVPAKYTFQSKLSFLINSHFSKGIGSSVFTQDSNQENHGTIHNSSLNYTAPTLDLYYSKNIGEKDEISVNLIGSHYSTNSYQLDHEWNIANDIDVFNNDMKLNAKQTGVVGEVAHFHNFEKSKLSSGYRVSNTAISNDLTNLLGSTNYNVNYLEQYLYTELSGQIDKLNYRVGVGITNIHNKSAETTSNDWAPNPKLVLSYGLAKNKTLRFTSDYTSISPVAEALSSNIVQVAPNIVRSGNPFLKPKHAFRNNLTYTYSSKYLDINSSVFYNYLRRDITQFYLYNSTLNNYALNYVNADFSRQVGLQISGSVKPFGSNVLVAKIFLQPTSVLIKTSEGEEIKNEYIQNRFALSSNYKNFIIQYSLSIPTYVLNGAFLNTTENANHLYLGYKLNNWTFSTSLYWMGMVSEYKTKSLPQSLVNYNNNTQILNNKNMFVVGLNYDFSTGKKLKTQKKLNNSTTPAATF